MLRRAATLCLLFLLGAPAWAAGSLDALREAARSGRDMLNRVKAEQLTRRSELSVLSQQIERLKTSAKGRLLRGSELDAALKKSQELSATLTALARVASARQADSDQASLTLLDALTEELTRLRGELDRQTERPARRAILASLRQLRVEREAVRASLPAARLPALEALKPTDDPEELLEQADLLRDNQEKVAKELKGLEQRIAERRQEIDLDRRLKHFLDEESMFDDQDRRLRVERIASITVGQPSTGAGSFESQDPAPGVIDIAPGSQYPTAFGENAAADTASSPTSGPPAGPPNRRPIQNVSGTDRRPALENSRPLDVDHDDLDRLEQERAKLKGFSEALGRQAAALEARSSMLARPASDGRQPVERR